MKTFPENYLSISALSVVKTLLFLLCLFVSIRGFPVFAGEKNGVGLQKISLPSGPGSIEGLGDSFEPQLNSGTASYSVKIQIPPGVAGHQPEVVLRYNGGSGNGPFGLAWSYKPMSIRRQTEKGLPTYGPNDVFTLDGEELVPLSDGSYRMENESSFMRCVQVGDGWEVRDRKGTLYKLGPSTDSSIQKPGGSTFTDTFEWLVEEAVDLHGNIIQYFYSDFFDSPGQLYCSEIRYSVFGGSYHAVLFDFEERPDAFSSFLSGFEIKMGRRCYRIRVESESQQVRRYDLAYALPANDPVEIAAPADAGLLFSQLRQVTQFDKNPGSSNYLPPLRFGYNRFDVALGTRGTMYNSPPYSLGNPNLALADINCDSLPDLLYTDSVSGEHRVHYNNGDDTFGSDMVYAQYPPGVTLNAGQTELADLDGDGRIDLVQKYGGPTDHFVVFRNLTQPVDNDDGLPAWDLEQSFSTPYPAFDMDDPSVRSLDLNGDKRVDYMRTTAAGFVYYYNHGAIWEEDGIYLFGEPQMGDITFADAVTFSKPGPVSGEVPNELVKLADMNGDRLLDLVRIVPGLTTFSIEFWPNKGRGFWGYRTEMAGDLSIGVSDLSDIFVTDVNGDGLSDVVVADYDVLNFWINLGNNAWSAQFALNNTPEYIHGQTVLRQADINGNGSTDFLWENWDPGAGNWKIEYFDFMGSKKPGLLAVIDNGIGLRTEIDYKTTTDFYVLARKGGTPWRTRLPFPSHVVSRISQHFGLDLDTIPGPDEYFTEMAYHDGYYDTFEKEFRGFEFAKKVIRGDDRFIGTTNEVPVHSPSQITRMRFHTGLPDGVDNDADGQYDEFDPVSGYEEESLKGKPLMTETTLLTEDFDGKDNDLDGLVDEDTEGQLNGLPADDDYVFTRELATWSLKQIHTASNGFTYVDAFGAPQVVLSSVHNTMDGKKVTFAFSRETVQELIEANGFLSSLDPLIPVRPKKQTRSETDVDFYGNTILQKGHGEDSPGSTYDDEKFTYTTYAFNFDKWILGVTARTLTQDDSGTFVSETRNYYDGADFAGLSLGVLGDRALMKREERFINGSSAVPALNNYSKLNGDPRLGLNTVIQSSRTAYDSFGNVITTRDANYTGAGAGHESEYVYDSTFHTYVEQETIHIGGGNPALVASATYDKGGGVMMSSTDFNGNQTVYAYDGFFRLVSVTKPLDTLAFPTTTYVYRPGDPFRALYYNYDSAGALNLEVTPDLFIVSHVTTRSREQAGAANTFDAFQFTDGAGHKLGIAEEGESSGEWVYKDVKRYTSCGHERDAYLPFFAYTTGYQVPPDHVPHVDNFYDAAFRKLRMVNPPETTNAGARRAESRTVFLPLEEVLYDEEDAYASSPHYLTPHTQYKDGLDRLIGVDEVNKESGTPVTYPTRYVYDLLDNLVRIVDSQNNTKIFRYDGLGRKIFMNDPDRGHMTWTYDDQGNLVSSLDAKSQIINFTYDGANRIKTEDYLDAAGLTPDVAYFYDVGITDLDLGDNTQATPQNTKGQLAYVKDLSGEEHKSYDARSRVDFETKIVPDLRIQVPVHYTTRFTYDSLDRVIRIACPDNDVINYEYNTRNLPERIFGDVVSNVIGSINYIASGQQLEIQYGNNVRTSYEYDQRLRLTRILTAHNTNHPNPYIDYRYDFDGASNIRRINDARPGTVRPAGDPLRDTHIFGYDDLYRITGVQYSFELPGSPDANNGQITYAYDRIGNMVSQTSDIDHEENGLPLANLGTMLIGGAAGPSGRTGRNPADPPGPHALTSIQNPASSITNRVYPYDANGNMTDIDGLICTWDFKDRMVKAENTNMVAVYTYDYTDRRITKYVTNKNPAPYEKPLVTTYVNKGFEVRDHDQPVKYVWNGDTRVAQIKATMSSVSNRVQRLRCYPGWNLLSIAVDATNAAAQLGVGTDPNLIACAKWVQDSNDFVAVTSRTPMPAGTVFWLNTQTATVIDVKGLYTDPTSRIYTGAFFAAANGIEATITSNAFPTPIEARFFNPSNKTWIFHHTGILGAYFNLPPAIEPGSAIYVDELSSVIINSELRALRVEYFHQNHIGSSTMLTDMNGRALFHTGQYPFGINRAYFSHVRKPPYQFTQKENDLESQLYDFGSRYYWPELGRFVSSDQFALGVKTNWLSIPQTHSVYAYCRNNPATYFDPDGNADSGLIVKGGLALGAGLVGAAVVMTAPVSVPVIAVVGVIGSFGSIAIGTASIAVGATTKGSEASSLIKKDLDLAGNLLSVGGTLGATCATVSDSIRGKSPGSSIEKGAAIGSIIETAITLPVGAATMDRNASALRSTADLLTPMVQSAASMPDQFQTIMGTAK